MNNILHVFSGDTLREFRGWDIIPENVNREFNRCLV